MEMDRDNSQTERSRYRENLQRRLKFRKKLELKNYQRFLKTKWDGISLTTRLVGVLVILLVGGLGITGVTVIGILQSHLIAQVDRELVITASKLAESYNSQTIAQLSRNPNNYPVRTGNYYIRYRAGNQIVTLPASITNQYGHPNQTDLLNLEKITSSGFVAPVTLGSATGGTPWRALSLEVSVSKNQQPIIVTVATPLERINETTSNVLFYVLVSSMIFALFGGLAAYYLVRLSLLPLNEIQAVAKRITNGNWHERIETNESANTEVGALAQSLNTMLSHIEAAFDAQKRSEEKVRRFVSDASHELRTPLAAIKGYGELYRLGGVPEEHTADVMGRIESEATRMGRLVDALLKLARLDEGQRMHLECVDLVPLCRNAAFDLIALSPGRKVSVIWKNENGEESTITGEDDPELIVRADSNQITQILSNLVSNANRYTNVEVPVELVLGKVTEDNTTYVLIQVRDHGAGLPEKELTRIFERFYRTDSSRSRETGGTGLGLPIVQAIAKSHGGNARAYATEGGGLTIEIRIPIAANSADS